MPYYGFNSFMDGVVMEDEAVKEDVVEGVDVVEPCDNIPYGDKPYDNYGEKNDDNDACADDELAEIVYEAD